MAEASDRLAWRAARLGARLGDWLAGRGAAPGLERFLHDAAQALPGGDALHGAGDDPLDRLALALGLDDAARDLVVAAGLPEEHEGYAAVLRSLHPRAEPWLAAGLAAQWLHGAPGARQDLRVRLETSPLLRCGVLRLDGPGPLFERSLRLADGLWSALHGIDAWPAAGAVRRVAVPDVLPGLDGWLASAEARRAVAALRAGLRIDIVLDGDDTALLPGRGAALVRAAGRAPLVLALPVADAGSAGDGVAMATGTAAAHALVRGAVPVLLRLAEPAVDAAPLLAAFPGALVVCGPALAAQVRPGAAQLLLPVHAPSPADRRALWQAALPALGDAAAALAAAHRVEPERAAQAALDAATAAGLDGREATSADIAAALHARALPAGTGGAVLRRPAARWDDLVLPAARRRQLEEAVDRLALQPVVLDDWGFLAGRGGTRGVRLLFSGPPGTGKTLAAEAMAGALGADLLVVDLSRVVSKWLGETEKNLAAVFDAAERLHAVLFIDEADALLGRRTEVADAHDRYANLETAYLLQRLERFEGLAVLATNLRGNLDPAFLRRLEAVVEFEEPDRGARAAIWRAHLPPRAPLADDVNLHELAALYPVVGGLIRNAALAAAFLAAADRGPIARSHLLRALQREYEKAGRPFPGLPPDA